MKSAVSMTNSLLLTEAQADPAKNVLGQRSLLQR